MADRPVLVEDIHMADWLRTGPKGVEELMISARESNPCKLAKEMRDEGRDKAPIFKSLITACREYRKKQGR